MQPGYYAAAGGMVTQMNRLDTISNNIANANTTAFKRDDVVIGDFLRLYKEAEDELPLDNHTKDASKFLNRSIARVPQIVEQYTERSIGAFMKTDGQLDFSLQREDLFFAIETPAGVRYTRDGSFTLNDAGRLVTKEGYPVLPKEYTLTNKTYIDIPEGAQISTDKNGNINDGENPLSNLGVFMPQDIKYMKKVGTNLYEALKPEEIAIADQSGSVLKGFLEKSNINVVKEMVSLVETNRLVEMYSKAMKAHTDDMDDTAINRLASARA